MRRRELFGIAMVACLSLVAVPAGTVEIDGGEDVGSDDQWDLIITGITATALLAESLLAESLLAESLLAESVQPAAVAAELGVTPSDLARALRASQIAIYELRDGRYEGPPVTDEQSAAARRLADLVAIWADTGVASTAIQPLAAALMAPWMSWIPVEAAEPTEEARWHDTP
ncbi:hypothetical protein [Sorangium sp. So ce854]|uniref:hypothetical protein n=1 Tax=Sorangium sp. So ce854 TaxID=3133322 RepID=UPI003F627474